jgi:predicted glycogen debranching enzyme
MIALYLGKADVNTYDKGADREFLVSNGAGSYGSSTVIGANTRSEHGLLVIRPKSSENHIVLVSKLEETLTAHNRKYQLSTNRYKDLIYPDGYRYLQEYQGDPYPDMLFVIHSIFLRKSIFMPPGGTCTVVRYELMESPETIGIDVRPLFAHRSNGAVCPDQAGSDFKAASDGGVVNVSGRGHISHVSYAGGSDSVKWNDKPMWLENLIYEKDGEADDPASDALWSPGYGSVSMKRGDVLYAVVSEEPLSYTADELESLLKETVRRQAKFSPALPSDTKYSMAQHLAQESRHLVTENENSAATILSGFPSAEKRARDAFIALPGLTLATGRADAARGILENWLGRAGECGGIMPSHIAPSGDAVTGDIDSGLWFVYAMEKYSASEGMDFARGHYGELSALMGKYGEGLPELGAVIDSGTKLLKYFNLSGTRNWMSGDAGGEPIVKRRGYLVEVNALWYDAMRFMAELAKAAGDAPAAAKYSETADAARESFVKIFWNERAKYLYDWVDPAGGECDELIRPNAIFAISLPHPVLPDDMGRAVFTTCWDHLYTTYGLRTLDPHNEKFKGRAEGRPDQKKKARLRGMAWPWLLANFISAYMRFHPDATEMGWRFLRPFTSHMRRGCLGGVAEYFDGVMPYKAHGDVLSAISVGELLRVMRECLIKG